jgi:uncharacterized OB-fold protein
MSEPKKISRPLPRPDSYLPTRAFWQAAKEHTLLLQYCRDSGRYQWFPRPVSLYTGRRNLEWREASGKGRLYSWTLTLTPWPGHEDRGAYVCAYVDLEEGVRMLCNIVTDDPASLRAGMPVKLVWERLSDEFEFPAFAPA